MLVGHLCVLEKWLKFLCPFKIRLSFYYRVVQVFIYYVYKFYQIHFAYIFSHSVGWLFTFFFKFYLFLKGREGEGGREISMCGYQLPLARPILGTWLATQACALTGNRTCDLWVHRLVLNLQSHTSQGRCFRF